MLTSNFAMCSINNYAGLKAKLTKNTRWDE